MKLVIYTDGGARGNPGPAGIGVVIYFPTLPARPAGGEGEGKGGVKKFSKFLGPRTNNEAEYEAVIAALEEAVDLGADEIELRLDSELVARQLKNIYKTKNHRMQALVLRVRNLETRFKNVSYQNIPREKNELADKLVNEAIDNNL